MRRSREVKLGLVSATAALLIGCGQGQYRQCVDQNQVVVNDRYCQQPTPYPYRWYYYSRGSRMYAPSGGHATGGSYSAPASSGTTRGVFGGTAEGHGAGGAGE
jgi:hypothetical protein